MFYAAQTNARPSPIPGKFGPRSPPIGELSFAPPSWSPCSDASGNPPDVPAALAWPGQRSVLFVSLI